MAAAPKLTAVPPTKKVAKKRAPENETARERFKRVATTRITNALDAIRLIGQMGTSTEYEYTEDEAQKIVNALNAAGKEMASKLINRKSDKAASLNLFD